MMHYAPLLMKAKDAAAYLGLSETKFRTLSISPRVHGGNRLFDRRDLDAFADSLPYDEGSAGSVNQCDALFGIER